MNDMTLNTAPALANLQKTFAAAAAKAPTVNFLPMLKFTKQGWILGKDQDEVTKGAKIVIRADSLEEGWLGWQNGKVVGETMRPVSGEDIKAMPRKEIAIIGKKDGWAAQYTFEGKFLEKFAKAEQAFIFKTTTNGGTELFFDVLKDIVGALTQHPEYPNPVMALTVSSYIHPEHGLTYKPKLELVDWMHFDSDRLLGSQKALADDADSLL